MSGTQNQPSLMRAAVFGFSQWLPLYQPFRVEPRRERLELRMLHQVLRAATLPAN